MKKVTALIMFLVLMICTVGSAMADDFTIHSGTTFGMNIEKVTELEKQAGFAISEINFTEASNTISIRGKVATYPDALIEYIFDNNDCLVSAQYTLAVEQKKGYTKALFPDLITLLSTKYNEPDSTLHLAIRDKFLESFLSSNSLLQFSGSSIIDSCAFIGKEDNDKIIVVFPFIVSAELTAISDYLEGMFILYQQFSIEEYYNAIQSMTEESASILDDI